MPKVTSFPSSARIFATSIDSWNFLIFLITWSAGNTNKIGSTLLFKIFNAAKVIAGAVFFPIGSKIIPCEDLLI